MSANLVHGMIMHMDQCLSMPDCITPCDYSIHRDWGNAIMVKTTAAVPQ